MKWILIMGILFQRQVAQTKPKPKLPPISNKQRWLALAPFIKKRFKTNMTTKEIAAELSLQEYYQDKKKREQWKRFSEEIG